MNRLFLLINFLIHTGKSPSLNLVTSIYWNIKKILQYISECYPKGASKFVFTSSSKNIR